MQARPLLATFVSVAGMAATAYAAYRAFQKGQTRWEADRQARLRTDGSLKKSAAVDITSPIDERIPVTPVGATLGNLVHRQVREPG